MIISIIIFTIQPVSSKHLHMTFPDGQAVTSDDDIIFEELNVEKGRVIESEVRGLKVISRGRLDGINSDKDGAEIDFREPSGKLRMVDGSEVRSNNASGKDENETGGEGNVADKDEARDSQRFEEFHHCNCGHRGSIASHLRSNQQCVQGIRDELIIGEEISDEVLIIQATLVLGGCPAAGCPGGNHAELPFLCLSWWKESGWNLMKWQEPTFDLNSAAIRERTNQFVEELTRGYEGQKQNKDENQDDIRRDVAGGIQNSGNLEEQSMEDPDGIFEPPIASTPVQRINERQEGQIKPATDVSVH